MKKWSAFFISLAIIILAAYYVIGIIVKNTLDKNINSIPKNSLMDVHFDKYKRGWFSSHAVLMFKIHIPAQKTTDKNGATKMEPPVDLDVDIPITVKHGPVIFTKNGIRFGLGQVTTRPETHYGALVNYFNQTVVNYTLPSFSMSGNGGPEEGEFQLNWLGLGALLSVSSNLSDIDGNLKLYGFDGSASGTDFEVGKVIYHLKLKRHQDWLWVGRSHFKISSAAMSIGGQKVFDLVGFDFRVASDVIEGALNFDCTLSLQRLFADNQTYGPGVLKLSIKNLDPAVMAKLNQQEFNMMQEGTNPDLAMLSLIAELPKLLTKGPVLELSEMTLNLPDGKIMGRLKISLPKNEANDPDQIMKKMSGEGQFKVPMTVVRNLMIASIKSDLDKKSPSPAPEPVTPGDVANPTGVSVTTPAPIVTDTNAEAQKQTETILQNLVNKGFLKVEGSDYVLNFTLENQQLLVNGQPFNPAMLQ